MNFRSHCLNAIKYINDNKKMTITNDKLQNNQYTQPRENISELSLPFIFFLMKS